MVWLICGVYQLFQDPMSMVGWRFKGNVVNLREFFCGYNHRNRYRDRNRKKCDTNMFAADGCRCVLARRRRWMEFDARLNRLIGCAFRVCRVGGKKQTFGKPVIF
jgi:hypothetical protein